MVVFLLGGWWYPTRILKKIIQNFLGLIRSYIEKENHIGSAVGGEILRFTHRQREIQFLLYYKDDIICCYSESIAILIACEIEGPLKLSVLAKVVK